MQKVRFANLSVKDIKIPERFIRKSVFVDDDFVNFIKERGVLQPIGVREIAPGYYELVYGYRRYLGTVKAGLETIPSTIMDLDDRQAREIMLVENEAREDPNPMDIAEHIEGMVQDYGYLEKGIAAMIDKSEPYVSNVLRVFREPFLREMVRSGKITFSAALELLTIRPDPLTEPSEYQNWMTFGAKSSEMGGSKAIRRRRQGKSMRLGQKLVEAASHPISDGRRDGENTVQKFSADDGSNFAKMVILLLTMAITLVSRHVSAMNSQDGSSVDRVRGTALPHYVPVNSED